MCLGRVKLKSFFLVLENLDKHFTMMCTFARFSRFDQRDFLVCAVAAAEFFVTEVFDGREVRAALIRITKSCYMHRGVPIYDEIYKQCIQRSRIRDLFKRASVDEELIAFYDEIKSAGAVKSNPYFWLQYAIARWVTRERGLVDAYLIKARKIGEEVGNFSPFQIDNFEAIVELDAQKEGNASKSLAVDVGFAVTTIRSQIDDERTADYSLRLIGLLTDLLEGREAGSSAKDIGQIRRDLRDLLRHLPNSWVCEEYPQRASAAQERLSRVWPMR